MLASGIFDDQKVELVAGKIYAMTDLPPHTFAIETLHEALRAMLPRTHWTIREEKPILIGRYWAPKPDISVLRENNTNLAGYWLDLEQRSFYSSCPLGPMLLQGTETGTQFVLTAIRCSGSWAN